MNPNPLNSNHQKLKVDIEQYLAWLHKLAVPCWIERGLDPQGAAYERLLSNGQADLNCDRRVRVQARQMFVFAAAHKNQWINNGLELIAGLDQYVQRFAKTNNSVIFAHILDKDNQVINQSHDLYDVAFFLLAYGWRYHVFNDLKALDYANKLLLQIDTDLKGQAGGWREGSYTYQYRRQNPHMHLFEAFLTLYSVTKDAKWLAKAGEIFSLFETIFFDSKQQVLLEFFNHDWTPCHDAKGQIIEPGHMFEWVWLLRQYSLLTGTPVDDYCHALYHKGLHYGLDQSSDLILDEVSLSNTKHKQTKRCWPMTEWIKAALAQATYCKKSDQYNYTHDAQIALSSLSKHFLVANTNGSYVDQYGVENQVISDFAPSSTLYHLVMAGLEAKRFIQDKKDVF
ncbi:AGE family epimerase/isomerase [Paraglaciecola aquimarina]|uniref:AGE family epimerase/isomerase n=1 Tax=Paraglaciecola algarum TaxID=3050085 RepID=A0ABS9D9N4_9ALTE|nr:AGE family epimerase/isomerase [Paraglaciecola sp. G1-23]MCF2949444.1 AGE family epimerase/isomerase [Paraglaciecola sp. G1-23]